MKTISNGVRSWLRKTYVFWFKTEINETELERIKQKNRELYMRHLWM